MKNSWAYEMALDSKSHKSHKDIHSQKHLFSFLLSLSYPTPPPPLIPSISIAKIAHLKKTLKKISPSLFPITRKFVGSAVCTTSAVRFVIHMHISSTSYFSSSIVIHPLHPIPPTSLPSTTVRIIPPTRLRHIPPRRRPSISLASLSLLPDTG